MPNDDVVGIEDIDQAIDPIPNETPEETQPAPETPEITNEDANVWYWDKENGVKGEGEKPEWLLDKYSDAKNQSLAYQELQKKLGSFTGSPKDGYKKNIPDDLKEQGFEIDDDDPIYVAYTDWAKENNLNQEGFDSGIQFVAMLKESEQMAINEFKQSEIESLGENAEKIIQDMKDYSETLPEQYRKGFLESFPTAESLRAGLYLINQSRPNSTTPNDVEPVEAMSEEDVLAMQFEKDEYGRRKINVDPEFRKKYEEASKRVRGSGRHIEIIEP